MKPSIYVSPQSLYTAAASRRFSDMFEESNGETAHPWEHKCEGDYLYLHPYWYAFDAQGKLTFVGKGDLSSNDGYKLKVDSDDLRLDLEMLLHMPTDQRMTMGLVQLDSMIVLNTNPDEPEHMFHVGAYVYCSSWLYRVNKRGVLDAIGRITSDTIVDVVTECLQIVGLEDCILHWAPKDAWESPRSKSDGALPPETKEQLVQRLMDGFMRAIGKRKQRPKIGDFIKATSPDGYTIEAYCVPDPGIIKHDPAKGKPFVFAISIIDPDGKHLMENNTLVD